MTLHDGTNQLLAAIPRVFDGVAVQVLDAAGAAAATFGTPAAGADAVRARLPAGSLVASVPNAAGPVHELVGALLAMVAERERLEGDMESMNTGSLRLLEQVSMYGETLPRLSAGGDDAEIAGLGARACQRAASVEQVLYLAHQARKGCCEVVVHLGRDGVPVPQGQSPLPPMLPAEGFLAEVLALGEGVLVRTVGDAPLGGSGTPEGLAAHQILGVPVTYGAGDKRVVLGVLLLVDKVVAYAAADSGEQPSLDNEEGQLAESFAAMLGAVLGARLTAAMGKELAMAQTIQRQILPERPAAVAGYDLAAGYYACGEVGGDYFDYVPLADGRTLVVVADVSGHNLASGMIMVGTRSMLRTLASVHGEPAAVFAGLSARMFDDLVRTERFLTAAAVALRPGSGGVEFVSAGHNAMLVYRAGQERVEAVATDSTILGFVPAPDCTAVRLDLQPGDCLLLYTDGITEAAGEVGEQMFGEERLAACFARLAATASAQGIVDGIVAEVEAFGGGRRFADDVTAVVVRYLGAAPAGGPR